MAWKLTYTVSSPDPNKAANHQGGSCGILIEVLAPITLVQATLYASKVGAGGTVLVEDDRGNLIKSFNVLAPAAGAMTLTFDLDLPIGAYWLQVDGNWSTGEFLRNPSSTVTFPYETADIRVVAGGTAPGANNGYYYWFYDLTYIPPPKGAWEQVIDSPGMLAVLEEKTMPKSYEPLSNIANYNVSANWDKDTYTSLRTAIEMDVVEGEIIQVKLVGQFRSSGSSIRGIVRLDTGTFSCDIHGKGFVFTNTSYVTYSAEWMVVAKATGKITIDSAWARTVDPGTIYNTKTFLIAQRIEKFKGFEV